MITDCEIEIYTSTDGQHRIAVSQLADKFYVENAHFDGARFYVCSRSKGFGTRRGASAAAVKKCALFAPKEFRCQSPERASA